jgi:hypothetical protein
MQSRNNRDGGRWSYNNQPRVAELNDAMAGQIL